MAKLAETNPTRTKPGDAGRPRVQPDRIERWQRPWSDIRRIANELHAAAETLIIVGDQLATDGYTSNLRGRQGHGSGDHPDPVLDYIEQNEDGPPPDLIADWLQEIHLTTAEALGHMRRIARLKDMILNRRDPRVTDLGGHCKACGRFVTGGPTDRLRSEYCDSGARNRPGGGSCYRAWLDYRRQILETTGEPAVPHLFEQQRQQHLDTLFGKA